MKSLVAVVAATGALVGLVGVSAASADPPAGTYGTLVGVGSDTTQSVMGGIASDYAAANSGNYLIASYDSVPLGSNIQTRSSGCTIARPSSSGTGEAALFLSTTNADGCVDFARSSSAPNTFAAGRAETGVPFAIDAVTYAVRSDSAISKSLSTANLTALYNCTLPSSSYTPLLPNFGSGTRKFFLSKLGFTDAANFTSQAGHTCVQDSNSVSGLSIEENTGTYLTDPKMVIPFSIAQYIGQSNGVASNTLGKAVLGRTNGIGSVDLNTGASYTREVYNMVPTAKLSDANVKAAFTGTNGQTGALNNSFVCQSVATIQKFGFAVDPNCGATNQATP